MTTATLVNRQARKAKAKAERKPMTLIFTEQNPAGNRATRRRKVKSSAYFTKKYNTAGARQAAFERLPLAIREAFIDNWRRTKAILVARAKVKAHEKAQRAAAKSQGAK